LPKTKQASNVRRRIRRRRRRDCYLGGLAWRSSEPSASIRRFKTGEELEELLASVRGLCCVRELELGALEV